MKAFILAAGKGKRLLPYTEKLPKPLLPFMGIPMLCYVLDRLKKSKIQEIIINVSHLAGDIKSFLHHHNNFGLDIILSEEKELLGTAGALQKCKNELSEAFILLNADIITDLDLDSFVSCWQNNQDHSLLAVSAESPDGKFSIALQNSRIVDFSNLANSNCPDTHTYIGNAILTPEIFTFLGEGYSSLISAFFLPQLQNEQLDHYVHKGWWYDLGSRERIRNAENSLRSITSFCNEISLELDSSYLKSLYKNIPEF